MISQQNLLPTPTGASVHRLQGKALRRWWLGWARADNKYKNAAIMFQVHVLLLLFPLAIVELWRKSELTKWILPLSILWIANFIVCLTIARRHLHHVLEVQESEDGLQLRSLFFKRKIRWPGIRDFFAIQDNDFVIDCTNGEQFILSSQLTESAKLFEDIKSRIPKPAFSYDCNYRLPDEGYDLGICQIFVLIAIVVLGLLKSFLYSVQPTIIEFAVYLVILLIALRVWQMRSSKIARIVRFSPSSILIRTPAGSRVLLWEQIESIKQRGGWFVVKSREYKYAIIAGKKGPLADKLLECVKNLPTLNKMTSGH